MRPISALVLGSMLTVFILFLLPVLTTLFAILAFLPLFLGLVVFLVFPDINHIQQRKMSQIRRSIKASFLSNDNRCDICGSGLYSQNYFIRRLNVCGIECFLVKNNFLTFPFFINSAAIVLFYSYTYFLSNEFLPSSISYILAIFTFILGIISLITFESDQVDKLYRYVPETFEEFERIEMEYRQERQEDQEKDRGQKEHEILVEQYTMAKKVGVKYSEKEKNGIYRITKLASFFSSKWVKMRARVEAYRKRNLVVIEGLGEFRICCNQTARLGEAYCQCGRGVPTELRQYYAPKLQ